MVLACDIGKIQEAIIEVSHDVQLLDRLGRRKNPHSYLSIRLIPLFKRSQTIA